MTTIHPFAAAFASSSSSSHSRRSLAPAPPPQNQSHSRPSLFKRHTAPSPAALLQLPTLEALPPTAPPLSTTSSFQKRIRRTTSSSYLPPPPPTSSLPPPPISTMPLLQIRRRPQSPKEQTSFLPFDIPTVVINTFGLNGTQRSPRSRRSPLSPSSQSHFHNSLSTPPAQSQPDTDHSFLPFSSSTPPSTLSRATGSDLRALPSIEGVIDELYGLPPPNGKQARSPCKREETHPGKTVKRDTMRLPLMSPPRSSLANSHKDDEPLNMSEWEWEAFGPMSSTVIIPRQPLTEPSSPASSRPSKRNTSLSIPHDFQPASSRTASSSRSMTSHQPLYQSHQSELLSAEGEGIAEQELKAMEVLEHLSGQLLRDQWGYGTGRGRHIGHSQVMEPAITRPSAIPSRSETCRSRSGSRPSIPDSDFCRNEARNRTMSGHESKESTSIRSWRDARKRPKQSPMFPTRVESFNAHIRTQSSTRRAPPPPPILPSSYDTNGDLADDNTNTHTLALEPNVQAVNNRLSEQLPPPVPPRSTQRQRLSAPNGQKSLYPQYQRSFTSLTSKASEESKGRKVPLILSSSSPSQLEEEDVVVINNTSDAHYKGMSLPPIQQRPLPPIPTDQPIQSPHRRSDSLAQRRLTTRILRPKRPITGASLPPFPSSLNSSQRGASPIPASRHESITLSQRPTPPKLVPRDERQPISRLSSNSNGLELNEDDYRYSGVVGGGRGSGRRKGMSAFSFLALDEKATEGKSFSSHSHSHSHNDKKNSQNKPRRRASSFGSIVSTTSHSRHNVTSSMNVRSSSPTPAYIIPPSERSKIGVDERRERRRRRKGSQSSLSSVAGSDLSHPDPDFNPVLHEDEQGGEFYEHLVPKQILPKGGRENEWSSAHTFNNSRIRERAHTCSTGNGTKCGVRERQYDYEQDNSLYPYSYPNSLSPPPRPKQTPTHLILNTSSNWNVNDDSMAPKTPSLLPPPRPRRNGNISNSTVPNTTTPVLIAPSPSFMDGGFSFQREFIELSSPSPSPATPHPPNDVTISDKSSGTSTGTVSASVSGDGDGESFWSTDEQEKEKERERERKRITNEWLKSKPTRHAYANGVSTRKVTARDHPFFR